MTFRLRVPIPARTYELFTTFLCGVSRPAEHEFMRINAIDTLEMAGKPSGEAKLDYHRPCWRREAQDRR